MQVLGVSKAPDAFRTISEVAEELDIPQHVLRFWETRFPSIRPLKRGGGRRYYRPDDVELLKGIRQLLYGQGYTIKGVQRILKEEGPRLVQDIGRGGSPVLSRGEGQPSEVAEAPAPPVDDEPAARPAPWSPAAGTSEDPYPVAEGPASSLAPADLERLRLALADLHECQRAIQALKRR